MKSIMTPRIKWKNGRPCNSYSVSILPDEKPHKSILEGDEDMDTKDELLKRQYELEKELAKVKDAIVTFDDTLHISSPDKPFREWTIHEQTELYNISKSAYEWFTKDREYGLNNWAKTIKDYNNTHVQGIKYKA